MRKAEICAAKIKTNEVCKIKSLLLRHLLTRLAKSIEFEDNR